MAEYYSDLNGLLSLAKCHSKQPLDAVMDIGGSLIKIVVFSSGPLRLATLRIDRLEEVFKEFADFDVRVHACTGGGSYRNLQRIRTEFGPGKYVDEMVSVALGVERMRRFTAPTAVIVNVGSGISILRADYKAREVKRIGGSCLGGGTFLALARIICKNDKADFFKLMESIREVDAEGCDMLVKDIYGPSGYPGLPDLPADWIASSLAKLTSKTKLEDALASLLRMFLINIAQIAALTLGADQEDCIAFTGSFITGIGDAGQKTIKDVLAHMGIPDRRVTFYDPYISCHGLLSKRDLTLIS